MTQSGRHLFAYQIDVSVASLSVFTILMYDCFLLIFLSNLLSPFLSRLDETILTLLNEQASFQEVCSSDQRSAVSRVILA